MADVLPELIHETAGREGDRVALVVDGADCLTYPELADTAVAVAGGLRARGVLPGDLVALLFPGTRWLDYVAALYGVLNAGAAAVVVSDGAYPTRPGPRYASTTTTTRSPRWSA